MRPLAAIVARVCIRFMLPRCPAALCRWSGICDVALVAAKYSGHHCQPLTSVCCVWLALQESLSLSHAVTVVLSQLYQARLTATAADPLSSQYTVAGPNELADGYDSSGTEH